MSAHMSDIEIKGHLHKLGLVVHVASTIPCQDLLSEFSHLHAVGPFVDPTGYRDVIDEASKNERLVRALGNFMAEVNRICPELLTLSPDQGDERDTSIDRPDGRLAPKGWL